jgi:transcriptional regulator with XRE-family HTH domain
MTYGDRVRRVRLDEGMDQRRFAAEIGVEQPTLGRHERLDEPPSRNRRAIASMIQLRFGVPADWVLTGQVPAARSQPVTGDEHAHIIRVDFRSRRLLPAAA